MSYTAKKGNREMPIPDYLVGQYADMGYEIREATNPEAVVMPAKRTSYTAAEYETLQSERDALKAELEASKALTAEIPRTQTGKKAEAASERAGW